MEQLAALANKRILLGVTGGIAAYKSAEFIRRLKDWGADVRVVMTPAAQEFITPLTLQALSGNSVGIDLLNTEAEAAMGHIELAKWADLVVVAPASADFIARFAVGMGNDLLTTVCLATSAPIAIAPAMNQQMWASTATQENLKLLAARSVKQFGPDSGSQACGDVGLGRMLDPNDLVKLTADQFNTGSLVGKTVCITAGPTREPIDPVRFLSNHSSGKMGYALAQACIEAGATVKLISGPVNISPVDRAEVIAVETAEEMLSAAMEHALGVDLFIAAAAVSDYRVAQRAPQKLKKVDSDDLQLVLVQNPDILASVAKHPQRPQCVVGFAAETNDVVRYAKDKLARKQLDWIVANDVSRTDSGFNHDDNAVTLISATSEQSISLAAKNQIAAQLVTILAASL
ncbi:bifunctional phosphopantothenoylcysteine decarboxylase/phosphopantothenate--cysteine ligase CoaBC [Umboniibacter marinipuniceus]|uniref:Coenzyme A biosynthesis bifunctional protein CoaBC n=1 Tax=Umboniibacter marinipuniceus TaxID=569599 RepID=A0A3M0AB27_9GAMM|nr:bifunctional phosphopantothenoylcysteine decarboxylase/phosphopantothenate--cysteine ligase CoaBC [Umboniibacter marinipuniceus]RMA82080.1 phosphopantothenoylcysteine decarboxylase/phosphopantothenate--cysteine ligase [Umboniibacter marinipuniceus]